MHIKAPNSKGMFMSSAATSSEGLSIGAQNLQRYSAAFNADRANRVAANAAVSSGVLKAATSYQGMRELPQEFSIELKQGSITNQERSGRCWMFASLNTLRFEVMHRWNLEDFEFSETYLFFWDKMEKANAYLENILATVGEPTESRTFQAINEYPADDGGWWQMFVNLVNKYGLMPKSAYPESANSRDSADFTQYLSSKLHQFGSELREQYANGTDVDTLRSRKVEDMEIIYRICAISLGEPPERFDFFARTKEDDDKQSGTNTAGIKKPSATSDNGNTPHTASEKSGKDERPQIYEHQITPLDFYHKYVPVNANDFVTLCNVPMSSRPFNKLYQLSYSTNVAETGPLEFVNVELDVFRKAAINQLTNGHPIWFACDCDQYSLRKDGVFDRNVVRVDELFGTDFTFDKAHGLEYSDYPSNHAMTITGVNLDEHGEPNRWKVENSWGKDNGKDGYYVASDEWFNQYITELVIRKDYLDDATKAILSTEPITLDPWQPLTRPCL
jgi:bleomycin hydrolase